MSAATPTMRSYDGAARPWYGWFVSDCIAVAKRQIITVLRIPQTLFFALFQPVLFVLLFSFVFGGAIPLPDGGSYREYLLPGIFAQTVTFAVAAATVGVAEDTSKGIMDRFRTLPVNQAAVIVGRSFAEMVERVLVISVMSAAGLVVGWRTHSSFLNVLTAYAMYLLFAYALTWMGIFVGLSVPSVQVAQTAGVAWVFPLTFLSNAFVPTQGMPVVLQHFAAWNPISCLALGGRTLFGNPVGIPGSEFPQQHPVLMAFLWSSAIIAVFSTMAVRKFRNKRG
ncbi:MAG: ABC transporter permease [Actinomycetales bacterium]|nr:ABC transporter permease [Actinomycetales bacterium]